MFSKNVHTSKHCFVSGFSEANAQQTKDSYVLLFHFLVRIRYNKEFYFRMRTGKRTFDEGLGPKRQSHLY